MISTSILHPDSNSREHLLRFLFNLIDEPNESEREILLQSFVVYARQCSPIRVQTELFPQLWENLSDESEERRRLVVDACGRLAVFLPVTTNRLTMYRCFYSLKIFFSEK